MYSDDAIKRRMSDCLHLAAEKVRTSGYAAGESLTVLLYMPDGETMVRVECAPRVWSGLGVPTDEELEEIENA